MFLGRMNCGLERGTKIRTREESKSPDAKPASGAPAARVTSVHVSRKIELVSGDGGGRRAEHEGYCHVGLDGISVVGGCAEIPILECGGC
jgi:hypothetical protein